jgi:hypothetical protein
MFKLNFKIAMRNLWKNKAFTFINIGGLAIGLASCLILLLYVSYEMSYDKQFTHQEKTYTAIDNLTANGKTPAGHGLLHQWPERSEIKYMKVSRRNFRMRIYCVFYQIGLEVLLFSFPVLDF